MWYKKFLHLGHKTIKGGAKKIARSSHLIILESLAIGLIIIGVGLGAFAWRLTGDPMDITFARDYIENAMNNDDDMPYDIHMDKVVLNWQDIRESVRLDLYDFSLTSRPNPDQADQINPANQANPAKKDVILQVDKVGVTISRAGLLIGKIWPKSFILEEPTLHLARTADNEFKLDIKDSDDAPPVESDTTGNNNADNDFIARLFAFLAKDKDQIEDNALSHLSAISIQGANIVVDDQLLDLSWIVPYASFDAYRGDNGMIAQALLRLPGRHGAQHTDMIAQVQTSQDLNDIVFLASIDHANLAAISQKIYKNDWLSKQDNISLSGDIRVHLDGDLALQDVLFSLQSEQGEMALPDLYSSPLAYKDLDFEITYHKAKEKIIIPNLGVNINDISFKASADMDATPQKISGPITLNIQDTNFAAIRQLVPDLKKDPDVQEWLFDKIIDGNVTDVIGQLNLSLQQEKIHANAQNNGSDQDVTAWHLQLSNPRASFDYSDLNLAYAPGLLPLTAAMGQFQLNGENLDVDVTKGKIANLNITNGTMKASHIFTNNKGDVDIKADLSGPLKSVVDYIQVDRVKDRINYDFYPDQVKGDIDFTLDLHFPTREEILFDTFIYEAKGQIKNGYWPKAFQDFPLSGGPFDISVSDKGIKLKGAGKLGHISGHFDLDDVFDAYEHKQEYDTKITAHLNTDDQFRYDIGIGLNEYIFGSVPIDITYQSTPSPDSSDDDNAAATANASANIKADLSQAYIYIEPLAYHKTPSHIQGQTLSANIDFNGDHIRAVKNLKISSPSLNLDQGQIAFRVNNGESALSAGAFDNLRIGKSAFTNLAFEITPQNLLKIKGYGPFLDARPFAPDRHDIPDDIAKMVEKTLADLNAKSQKNNTQDNQDNDDDYDLAISLKMDQLQAGDQDNTDKNPAIYFDQAQIYVEQSKDGYLTQLEADAKIKSGDVYLRYKPDENGEKNFNLTITDAGNAFRAMGVYDDIVGGKFSILATPKDGVNNGNFTGEFMLEDFHVKKAPILAQLISALSLPGLGQLLENDGMKFSRLEAKFDWLFQEDGGKLILKKGRSSGNSLGLTFEGFVNQATSRVDVNGTVVPVSGLNTFVSNIPLIGNVMAGDKGEGIFAATYKIKGDMANPDVTLNPLAALAPGFLRDILFENNKDETDIPPADADKPLDIESDTPIDINKDQGAK